MSEHLTGHVADRTCTVTLAGCGGDAVIAGRFRVRSRLGRGASKEVYLAYDRWLDRDVALAIVVGGADREVARARIQREAMLTGRLGDHPNIITVYDTGEDDGVPYLVLRAMQGGSLADALARRRPSLDDATRLGSEIASALAHSHAHGIVHRDVKPDNVWLSADGSAALGDFGIASQRGMERLTVDGGVVGTVGYLSPEQIRGDELDAASDLYALGVTLYELVTGRLPFLGSDAAEVLAQHLTAAPRPPSAFEPSIAPALERLILDMLAKQPAHRPASAADVQRELADLSSVGDLGRAGARPVMCPFKGLAPFDADDARYFCGRDRLVAQLVGRFVGTPVLGILGPSGTGKSSVLRAGLLPALAGGALPGSENWTQRLIRPGAQPAAELQRALDARPAILAVDQLEEIFGASIDERERRTFIDALVASTRYRDEPCTIVVALRADFYGRCAMYPELAAMLGANHVLVGPMSDGELRDAIETPARRAGLHVDDELVDALVADLRCEPGALPLLSSALLELWQLRDGLRLTLASYRRTGGVSGAVSRLAENAFGQLDDEHQPLARGVLMRLVGDGGAGGVERRRVALDELGTLHGERASGIVATLTRSRLLTVTEGAVEFAHEALLREWPRLQRWIEQDREGPRIQRSLNAAAHEWLRLGEDDGALYRGGRLDETQRWQHASGAALSDLEHRFLTASQASERHAVLATRRSARRLRTLAAGLAGLAIVVALLASWAIGQRDDARRQAAHATALALEHSVIAIEYDVARVVETTDPMWLHAVAQTLKTYPAQRDDLLRLTSSDPSEYRQVQRISDALDGYVARWGRPLLDVAADSSRPYGLRHLIDEVRAGGGRSQLDAIVRSFELLLQRR